MRVALSAPQFGNVVERALLALASHLNQNFNNKKSSDDDNRQTLC